MHRSHQTPPIHHGRRSPQSASSQSDPPSPNDRLTGTPSDSSSPMQPGSSPTDLRLTSPVLPPSSYVDQSATSACSATPSASNPTSCNASASSNDSIKPLAGNNPDKPGTANAIPSTSPPGSLSRSDIPSASGVSSQSDIDSSIDSERSGYSSPETPKETSLITTPASSDASLCNYGSTARSTVLSIDELHEKPLSGVEVVARARLRKRLAKLAARNLTAGEERKRLERRRDWSFGPITGHRVIVTASIVICTALVYVLQEWLWPKHRPNVGLRAVFADFSFLWMTIVLPSVLGMIGALMYRHNDKLDEVKPIDHMVFWRIVSRGTNREALGATVERVRKEMSLTPLFPYVIEVVTDVPPHLPPSDDLIEIIVPTSYQAPNLSKFKARALHYALTASVAPDNAWLVHLDEETHPTSSGVKGICDMIAEEEHSGELRIGQGALLYHRMWHSQPFLTLADNMRTGDDIARFYLQHCFGITIFGLHGSYIVCRNDVEKSVGFDFGPIGSITEDAFWALVCMENGSRSRWVDGYLEEQATQSVMDFLKQRRRWFHGLVLVSLYAPVELRYRLGLMVSTVIWGMSPLATVYTVANFFVGANVNWIVRFLANFSVAFYCTLYLIGAIANLDELAEHTRIQKIFWCTAQVLLIAVFSLIEGLAVMYAIVRPETGFHVVTK